MKNILLSLSLIFLFSTLPVQFDQLLAQCPGADECEDAYVFCSLDELNGFTCNNPGGGYNTKDPGCIPCCFAYRTWWAFISQGGSATITFNVGNCTSCCPNVANGMIWGIWGNCECTDVLGCTQLVIAPNKSITYHVDLEPCKIYYIGTDKACDCLCDFTISTSGGGPPTLTPLSFINNISKSIIEPVCVGVCKYKFFVNPVQGSCPNKIKYLWTLDGVELNDTTNEIRLDFPQEGDFELCVTAYIGYPNNGSYCAEQGPKCAIVKVRPLPDRTGIPRTLCYEDANPKSFRWHSQYISTSGNYKERLIETNCCPYDSVVEFIVLPKIEPTDVFYISCDSTPFVDSFGHSYPLCMDHALISLPKLSDHYKCDSAILLTSVNIGLIPNWSAQCFGAQVEISPNLKIIDTCNVKTTHKLDYKWYKKADITKTAIGNNEQLLVNPINTDYCLDIVLKVFMGFDSATCIKTECENIDESKVGVTNLKNVLTFCDSAIINGNTYTQSTTLTQKFKSVFGCDSIINTEINIQKTSQSTINLIGCDSLIVNGQIYTLSTNLTQNLKTTNGCDSIIVTDLKITKSSSSNVSLKSCDSIIVNGKVYDQSGNYTQTLINSNNCDSTLNLDLTIPKSNRVDFMLSGCDSLLINGKVYNQTGFYTEKLHNVSFCDSLVNFDLTIFKTQRDSLSFSDCEKVVYKGKIYTQTGDYPEFYKSVNGCDSINNVHINITSSNKAQLNETKCDSVTINGIFYDQSGIYTQKLISANGCDSTLNINLTIGTQSSYNYKLTSCDSVFINSQWYYQSGSYTQKLINTYQCDSTLNIELEIKKSTTGDTLFRSCDSVMINGITYKQTGIYQQKLVNAIQCDSMLIIDFARLSKSSTNLKYKSCDSISINGKTYNQTGFYSQILSNANQCDSLLNLDIKIAKSNSKDSVALGCDSLIFNGQTYHQSGNYSQKFANADQCDSTLVLNLTINKSSSINYSTKACDAININGQIFNQSGNYTQYLKDIHQCDSTIYIQLTINNSDSSALSKDACDSIMVNGIPYYNSGQYKQDLKTNNGCDSTLTIDLIIKPGNPSSLDAGVDTSICEGDVINLNGKFSGNANFFWHSANGNFDDPNNLITNYYPTLIGNERIYLQAADDCKQWLDSLEILVLPRQIVQVTGDTLVSPCKEISFTASGGTNYTWTPSSQIECIDPACSRVRLKSTNNLMFTITTNGPCVVPANLNLSLTQIQTEVWLPNAFSPNGDNINDIFLPVFNCEQVDFYNLQIFDRWGNLVFESSNKDKGWNGKYLDQNMNPGVYPYVVQYQIHGAEKKVKAGDITLVR